MTWLILVAVFLLLTPPAVVTMRRDYRRHGRLSWPGFALLTVWFFVPHLALDFAVRYGDAWGLRQLVGLGVMVLGAAILLTSVVSFRSVKKVFARAPGTLTDSGPYRWSRNPQYVGWFLFLLGFAVMGWTWRCWIALGMLVVALQILVLVEEEHLRRVFGAAYRAFCERIPRWVGRGRR